jgi:predicted metal-dependent hydrolase
MPEIDIEGEKLEYSIRRSEKASKPRIDSKLEGIRVVIPEGSDLDPEKLLENRSEWVREKYREKRDFLDSIEEKDFVEREEFLYRGDKIQLLTEQEESEITEQNIKTKASEPRDVEEEVRKLYRKQAKEIFSQHVDKYSERIDGEFNEIQVRNQRTRWGSCTAKNNLSFNWRIIMAPEFVSEYLVVHELVHLEHSDHSQKFWKRVKELFPRYEESEKWLDNNQNRLALTKNDIMKSN